MAYDMGMIWMFFIPLSIQCMCAVVVFFTPSVLNKAKVFGQKLGILCKIFNKYITLPIKSF